MQRALYKERRLDAILGAMQESKYNVPKYKNKVNGGAKVGFTAQGQLAHPTVADATLFAT